MSPVQVCEAGMLLHANAGMLRRFCEEVTRRLREISPQEADWREKFAAYLLKVPNHVREVLNEATDRLRAEGRPLKASEIFGSRFEPKKANALSAARTAGILGNDRSDGYFLPFWPAEKIARVK